MSPRAIPNSKAIAVPLSLLKRPLFENSTLKLSTVLILVNVGTNATYQPPTMTVYERLPILKHESEILTMVKENDIFICVGETGSGKSTQLPQILFHGGYTKGEFVNMKIGVTQPRRVATIALSNRVSDEMASTKLVGYQIRFEEKYDKELCKVKFMTDGILLRETLVDPLLSQYSVVMLDEAHERSLSTDILFGLLKGVVEKRRASELPALKLVITSATLDCRKFSKFYDQCPVLQVKGRSYPVDIYHSKNSQIMTSKGPIATYVKAVIETTLKVNDKEEDGHILVFLTGQQEIENVCAAIRLATRDNSNAPVVLPLYGALQGQQQGKIFENVPSGVRKIIVATNIAETSLTIANIRYVVDAGYVKQKVYNPAKGMEALVVVPISKVSAQQRAGRAGRTAEGKCYRLYSKESYHEMMKETVPEIKRSNLANTILYLKVLGIDDVIGFRYLDPPQVDAIEDALVQLHLLGAIDKNGNVTPIGKQLSLFPLEPNLGRVVVESIALDCFPEVIRIVAMLSVENIYVTPKVDAQDAYECHRDFFSDYGDHISLLRIMRAWEDDARENRIDRSRHDEMKRWCKQYWLNARALRMACLVVQQLLPLANSVKSNIEPIICDLKLNDRIRKSFCAGFFMKAARRCTIESVYKCLSDDYKLVHIHPSSSLHEIRTTEFILYQEIVHTSRSYLRNVLCVEKTWLDDCAGAFLFTTNNINRYQLSGRVAPAKRSILDEKTKPVDNANKRKGVTSDTIAMARARYAARKKQAKLV